MNHPIHRPTLTRRSFHRLAGGAGALALTAATACQTGGQSAGSTTAAVPPATKPTGTVSFWHSWGTRGELMRSYLDKFEQEHPGVKVEVTEARAMGGRPKFVTAILAGTVPDVNQTFPEMLPDLVPAKVLAPLDPYVKRDKVDLKAFYDVEITGRTFDGKLLALPSDTWAQGHYLYWNKDLFKRAGLNPEKPPANWDETEELAVKLTVRGGGDISQLGLEPGLEFRSDLYGNRFIRWLYNNNGTLFDPTGKKVAFAGPEGLQTMEWLKRVVERMGGLDAAKALVGREPFFRGQVALKVEQQLYPSLIRLDPQGASLNWGVTTLPFNAKNPKARLRVPAPGSHGYSLMSGAKNPEAGWTLIKWLTTSEFPCDFLTRDQGRVAPLRRCAEISEAKGKPEFLVFSTSLASATPVPLTGANEEIAKILAKAMQEVIEGKKSSQQALDEAAREAQNELDKATRLT